MEDNIARLIRDHEQGANHEPNTNDVSDVEMAERSREPIEIPIKSLDDFNHHEEQLKTTSYRKKIVSSLDSVLHIQFRTILRLF